MTVFEAAATVDFREYISGPMGLDTTKDGRILCPFHSDSSPSFSTKKNTNIGRCFVCMTKAIDLTEFVSKIQRISKLDAAKEICKNMNIKYESTKK